MIRDFQRSKLYAWERVQPWWTEGDGDASIPAMTMRQCEALIKRATRRYGCSMPRVRDGRGARWARGGYSRITLPRWARTVPVVLHETAHCINHQRISDNDKHGPVFVRLFIQLLATYMGLDEAEVVRHARVFGLKVAGHQPVRKSTLRRAA